MFIDKLVSNDTNYILYILEDIIEGSGRGEVFRTALQFSNWFQNLGSLTEVKEVWKEEGRVRVNALKDEMFRIE